MIDLITGLPGNAKTLYTIGQVRDLAARENRPVYYSGIPQLTLEWFEIDPTKWMDVPPKSIVVIDEAQRIFRNRSLGAQPPKHVTDLETHRHLGIDLFFITRHPSLIDPAIRRLAGRHRHMVRVWGMEVSTVHKWDSVKDNCDKPAARKDSEKTKWAFDKAIYKLYKSADEHTMKRAVPLRVKLLFALPFVVFGLGYVAYAKTVGKLASTPTAASAAVGGVVPHDAGQVAAQSAQGVAAPRFDPVADKLRFVQMNTPRIEGLPQTAPKYDQLTTPTAVPIPAGCIQVANRCRCYTQQGTSLDVGHAMCMGIVRNGFFQEFDADRDKRDSERTGRSVQIVDDAARGGKALPNGFTQVTSFSNPAPDPPHVPRVGKGS